MTWQWIAASLAVSALMYAAGRFDWTRSGRRRVWSDARAHFETETRALVRQLLDDERELAWRREVEHAEIRDPRCWSNGAGYRSSRSPDSRPAKESFHASA
ncbi:hypothetical protein O7626_39655 [Micromonospora sp. WMMD1102]|uniref:hypothetical protein n=1 Tax=Micromonospora sp. WMMD1102 TaxID=3016105 RepID=UPI0024153246|nr:hypothetical protein [Micromonospora sp. WMMD1102]MDG4791931.1 hypothetical protein [Micromonospora sp. WMMD1102]